MNEILRTLQTKLGCDVNDSAAPLSEHAWQDGTGAEERAAKIRSDHLVPHFRRHVREVGLGENASVVNEDVNAAELFQHGINHALHVALLCGGRADPVIDGNPRPLRSEGFGDASADAATRPGHQSGFTAEFHVCSLSAT